MLLPLIWRSPRVPARFLQPSLGPPCSHERCGARHTGECLNCGRYVCPGHTDAATLTCWNCAGVVERALEPTVD